ncbi:MAG TPA: glycosyltransferase family 2 protein [Candidatus Dormibacteraeota bacterium]|nr:glycosyltransferase family 2 protein [Candidatus Dormibacteraeota bacterium]
MKTNHISVCICTFKRPELLTQLLERLACQHTEGAFTYSVVVADNDTAQSAQSVVASFCAPSRVKVTYCNEPEQNIALARNKALQHAEGDLIAFIDDDEFPVDDWLYNLIRALTEHSVDGVLGPVKPYYEAEPPRWVKDGKFFQRATYPTGYKMTWTETRTGNVLFRREILAGVEMPFKPEFGTGGEDVDFFRRMISSGFKFIWCNEGFVYEVVPASRCSRSYLLKRALLRGINTSRHPSHRLRNAAKSLVAVPCYAMALPILAIFGQHVFLKYLIKLCDHSSRLLAYLGLRVITERQN